MTLGALNRRSIPDALVALWLFAACWAIVHTWFWAHHDLVDWPTYQTYGAAMRQGYVPYRDFAVEYPPGALPMFFLPVLVGSYASTFAWLMAICGGALVLVVATVSRPAAYFAALAPVLVGSLILSRYDLWPALLLVCALSLLLSQRHTLGWAFLGAAVAAKLWPIVVVPLALVWSWRRGSAWSALAGAVVVALAFVPFFVLSPGGMWHSLEGQASRPLQIESLGASLVVLLGHPQVVSTHGSQNVAGHGTAGAVLACIEAAVLLSLWVAFARGDAGRDRLLRYSAACVAAFVAFDKVLSPQYLLWLVPLVPLVRGRRGLAATAVLILACVLTQVWFPERYFSYALQFHLAWVVFLRDLALVALVAVLAWPTEWGRESLRSS
ncbi:MAG TPA: glycosyltransferase 87 family protein [Gaiellaceae bacterium]|nr:glycosyltransferase 87 family protein [Gaiellaceae bacterium]